MYKLILALTLGVAGCYGTSGYVSDGYYGAYYSSYPSYYYGSGYYAPYYTYRSYPYAYRGHYGHRPYYGGTYGRGYYGNSHTYHPGDVRPHAAGTAVGSPWAASRDHRRH
jgi:hypothetical protein